MKTNNPSDVTRARRAVDTAVLKTARIISDRLSQKARVSHIACWGLYLTELYEVHEILERHERSGRRELSPEGKERIGQIICRYTEVKKSDNSSWLGILKPMVGQPRV